MGVTKHYIEIRSKCCNVKTKDEDYEEEKEIPIIFKVCGCDDPRYTFDCYIWNRTYVVPIAVELYYEEDLIIHIDLSNKLFFGKPSKYKYEDEEEYCWYFDAGNTVKYKIPAEYRNKEIKILYISESPSTKEKLNKLIKPTYKDKDKDCSVCKTSFAEEDPFLQFNCDKYHKFHERCLSERWLNYANYIKKDGYRYCPICHYFKKPHIYCSGGGKNNLQEFCIEYIIYNEIKVNTLPIPLQNKIKEKMLIIREDTDLDYLDF